jgi:hypothetical protein
MIWYDVKGPFSMEKHKTGESEASWRSKGAMLPSWARMSEGAEHCGEDMAHI